MKKIRTIIFVVIFSLLIIGASCHPKKVQPPQVPPPQPKLQEPEQKLQPKEEKKEEKKIEPDTSIKEEIIAPESLPPKEKESPYQLPPSPTLGAAENMAKEALKILEKGDATSAALVAERAIGLEPYCGYCYYALASIRAAQKMWKDVIPLATSALQFLSDNRAAKAAYIRALAYYNSGDLESAKADCEYALSIDPEFEAAKRLLSALQ